MTDDKSLIPGGQMEHFFLNSLIIHDHGYPLWFFPEKQFLESEINVNALKTQDAL